MDSSELKHVIALLLEDAKRLQVLEPNAGTEARIWVAKDALMKGEESGRNGQENPARIDEIISYAMSRLEEAISCTRKCSSKQGKLGVLIPELELIQTELKNLV